MNPTLSATTAPPANPFARRLLVSGSVVAIAGAAWLVDPLADAAFDAPKRLAVLAGASLGVLGLAWGAAWPRWRCWSRHAWLMVAALVLLAAWLVVAAVASVHADIACTALRRILVCLMLIPIGASRALDGPGARLLFGAFALACASNALFSLLQFGGLGLPFAVAQIGGRFQTGALLGNEGYVALASAMLGAAGMAIVLGTRLRRERALGSALLAVAIATIAANRQATSAVALLAAAGLLLAVRCGARRAVGAAFGLVALGAISAAMPTLRAATWQRMPLDVQDVQRLTTFRLGAWVAALDMARSRPWTGYGPGTFGAEQQVHRFAVEVETRERFVHPLGATFVAAHDDYLQLAAEAGWPAVACALAALAAMLHGLVRRLARAPTDLECGVLFGILVVGAIAALAWFPMQIPLTAAVLLLAAGRAWRLISRGDHP
ncbi:MAG TPA: O-antigen ligase family protein [Dokdonella sp.]|nr:O-antigen ligase family protein [Dokdonella sp.]